MISSWFRGTTREEFLASHFQRAPLAHAETAARAIRLLTWETIARLVESQPDMLVVRNGVLRSDVPATFRDAMALFREGHSLVMRRCERNDAALRRLADSVSAEFAGDVSIQVYATPAGYQSFSWHYDCEDVFIAQTLGRKDYFLRENSMNPRPRIDAMPRDMQYERETSTTKLAATLVPGDWLYIPRGWWHFAKGIEDSLSISIGILSPDAAAR
ncbi:MAG: JmjC domain-containing protein [Thermoanaerobaculia bacterium]